MTYSATELVAKYSSQCVEALTVLTDNTERFSAAARANLEKVNNLLSRFYRSELKDDVQEIKGKKPPFPGTVEENMRGLDQDKLDILMQLDVKLFPADAIQPFADARDAYLSTAEEHLGVAVLKRQRAQ